ncbi:MAG: PPOX class F420-dependent oxidoreductase [Bacteroidota bacterium]|jgi:PPOX class probable F420-dependent enzyme
MAQSIPDDYRDLFDKKAFAMLATVMSDGSPQVTPVWVDFDGSHLRFNSARGRVKDKNVRHDPRVAMTLVDPDNPYRYLQVRGRVVEITEQGADQHIDKLSKKYLGQDTYPYRRADEVRVIYRVEPEKVSTMG